MKPRRRAGRFARGGRGRLLIARLTPTARHEYLGRLPPDERRAVIAAANPRAAANARAPESASTMHDVVMRGIVAACTKCEWRGAADEGVQHVFGR